MPEKLLTDLPADVVGHIVARLALAFHVARAAPTCKVVSVAARNAIRGRGFSSEVVTLAGHTEWVNCVAAVPDGRVITASDDDTVKVWRDGACERTIRAQGYAVAVLPCGARLVSGSHDCIVKSPTGASVKPFCRTLLSSESNQSVRLRSAHEQERREQP